MLMKSPLREDRIQLTKVTTARFCHEESRSEKAGFHMPYLVDERYDIRCEIEAILMKIPAQRRPYLADKSYDVIAAIQTLLSKNCN